MLIAAFEIHGANARRTVVISDTHFGVGSSHAIEDFRWAAEWRAFLAQLRKSAGATDLILDGDTVELWQSLGEDCRHPLPEVGCTEEEALARMQVVAGAHRADFAALCEFANHGSNRVWIVPGNHDAALLYPRVAAALVKAIGAEPGRVRLERAGFWRSADGLVHVEHGHQADAANAFPDWPEIAREVEGVKHLERPWGEQFVQAFYNEVEKTYPAIDNIITEADAARYAIAAEGFRGTHHQIGRFASFILFNTTVGQTGETLSVEKPGSDPAKQWNVKAARAQGAAFFIDAVSRNDPARPAIATAADQGVFDKAFDDLTDNDVIEICNERAALHAKDDGFVLCPRLTAAAFVEGKVRGKDKLLWIYLNELRKANRDRPIKIVVLAHTHDAFKPVQAELDGGTMTVVNTGAWQRLVPKRNLEDYQRKNSLNAKAILKELTLDRLAPCYSFVEIPPYTKLPSVSLKYWTGTAVTDGCLRTIKTR